MHLAPRRRLAGFALGTSMLLAAVHAVADAPAGRYTFKNGGVFDNRTKLTWRSDTAGPYALPVAKSYCSDLGSGWRLPTIKELLTIVDLSTPYAPRIDASAFPNSQVNYYWSSTAYSSASSTYAWAVHFGNLNMTPDANTTSWYVRCVR